MSPVDLICQAIESRTPISFQYNVQGKTPGGRTGNPHAVFIRRLKAGGEKTYLHLWQTGGVSDSGGLPSFKTFFVSGITDVQLHPELAPFPTAEGYNPGYYEFPLAKV